MINEFVRYDTDVIKASRGFFPGKDKLFMGVLHSFIEGGYVDYTLYTLNNHMKTLFPGSRSNLEELLSIVVYKEHYHIIPIIESCIPEIDWYHVAFILFQTADYTVSSVKYVFSRLSGNERKYLFFSSIGDKARRILIDNNIIRIDESL